MNQADMLTAIEALEIADEHVRWALSEGRSLEEILRSVDPFFMPAPINASIVRSVIAARWMDIQTEEELVMNAILSSSEIKADLVSTALKVLWHRSGECSARDLVSAGHSEGEVAKYGDDAIQNARKHYEKVRAS